MSTRILIPLWIALAAPSMASAQASAWGLSPQPGGTVAQAAPAPAPAGQPAPAAQPAQPAAPSPEAAAAASMQPSAQPVQPAGPTLTLAEALKTERKNLPTLRQQRATTEAFQARVGQAAAPLWPQVNGTLAYQLRSINGGVSTGTLPTSPGGTTTGTTLPTGTGNGPPPNPYSIFSAGLTVNQLIYDFGQVSGKKHSAQASAEAQERNEHAAQLIGDENVRVAFFNARAAKSLLAVAVDTLANYERHLHQIEGFVSAGTRAEIDAVQARTDRANAKVQVINAENQYATARATLNQAMGVEQSTDYEVADENIGAIDGEDADIETLVKRGMDVRPEFASLNKQVSAQEYTLGSIRGARWPSLGVAAGATEAGRQLDNMFFNWNAGVTLTWPIFSGGITIAQADEVEANLRGLEAQRDQLRQQLRVDLEQARLSVRASKAALEAADEVVLNARERQRLAEGRYNTGVGNGIELGDAQLALSNALAQRVQSDYNLSLARAQLIAALGQE
jgi:outer membrane protein